MPTTLAATWLLVMVTRPTLSCWCQTRANDEQSPLARSRAPLAAVASAALEGGVRGGLDRRNLPRPPALEYELPFPSAIAHSPVKRGRRRLMVLVPIIFRVSVQFVRANSRRRCAAVTVMWCSDTVSHVTVRSAADHAPRPHGCALRQLSDGSRTWLRSGIIVGRAHDHEPDWLKFRKL